MDTSVLYYHDRYSDRASAFSADACFSADAVSCSSAASADAGDLVLEDLDDAFVQSEKIPEDPKSAKVVPLVPKRRRAKAKAAKPPRPTKIADGVVPPPAYERPAKERPPPAYERHDPDHHDPDPYDPDRHDPEASWLAGLWDLFPTFYSYDQLLFTDSLDSYAEDDGPQLAPIPEDREREALEELAPGGAPERQRVEQVALGPTVDRRALGRERAGLLGTGTGRFRSVP